MTTKELQEAGRKGGIKSGETKRNERNTRTTSQYATKKQKIN